MSLQTGMQFFVDTSIVEMHGDTYLVLLEFPDIIALNEGRLRNYNSERSLFYRVIEILRY